MEIPKATLERLAKAWLVEAKRLRMYTRCDCGCGQEIKITRFKSGHDAKLLSQYREKIAEIIGSSK